MMSERELQREVLRLARFGGWVAFHAYDAKRVVAGWPDLVLIRPPEFVVVELKTERGRLTEDQAFLLAKFDACGIETHVWTPTNLPDARDRLRARAAQPQRSPRLP